jgi:uncharacterized protein
VLRTSSYLVWSLVAAGGYGALYFVANRSVYFPSRYPEGFWNLQAQLGATDVWLEAPDGARVHAWSLKAPGKPFVTLFLHGNAGNITHRFQHLLEITNAGSSVFIPDYRGYGTSSVRPTEKGLYADAEAAYEYLLRNGYGPERIIVHGESLGTAVAVHVASRRSCAALVLEAAFTSAKDVARTVLPVLGPALIWSFDSEQKIGGARAPMLFIHGDRDGIIPLRLGQALFNAAPQPKSFWTVPGAGHNDILYAAGANYRERLRSFYDSLNRPGALR